MQHGSPHEPLSKDEKIKRERFGEPWKFAPIIFLVATIAFLYLTYMCVHIIPLLDNPASRRLGLMEMLGFHFFTFMLLLCYVKAILENPGEIPDDEAWIYGPDARVDGNALSALNMQELKKSGDRRHCKWCGKYKPDRCHHCRVCRTCVLKMDHHCPWLYNCVGFYNYKYFFLLLFYSGVTLHFMSVTMSPTVTKATDIDTPFVIMFFTLFGEVLSIFLGTLITAFFIFHIWLILKAMTTIEFCEKKMPKDKAKAKVEAKPVPEYSVYYSGWYGNAKSVLGANPFTWLIPTEPAIGDGLNFVTEETRLTKDLEATPGVRRRTHKTAQRVVRQSPSIMEYEIILDKADGAALGVQTYEDYVIESITKGLVETWNTQNPSCKVREGDRIVEVNGVRGDIPKMRTECHKSKSLRVKLLRVSSFA